MSTAADNAAFASIPTVNVHETVRITVRGVVYNAEELLKGVFEGSRTFAYTNEAGNGCIIRIKTA